MLSSSRQFSLLPNYFKCLLIYNAVLKFKKHRVGLQHGYAIIVNFSVSSIDSIIWLKYALFMFTI